MGHLTARELITKASWGFTADRQRGAHRPKIKQHEMYLGVQDLLRHLALRLGARKGVGEEEHALAAVHDKEVVWYVGSSQALAGLPHHHGQVLHRATSLKHQTAHLHHTLMVSKHIQTICSSALHRMPTAWYEAQVQQLHDSNVGSSQRKCNFEQVCLGIVLTG